MPICAISIPRWWFFPLLALLLVPGAASALKPEVELEETLEAIRDLERSQEERQAALEQFERRIGDLARGTGETRQELRRLEKARAAQAEVIGEHEEHVRREERRLEDEREAAARLVRDQWLRERHAGRIASGSTDGDPEHSGRHHAQFGVYIREAREEALQALRDRLQALERARADLLREQEVLVRQGEEKQAVVAELEREQRRQRAAMAELEAVIEDEALELERLRRNAETLEAVIRQVEEDAAARTRADTGGGAPDSRVSPDVAFSALKGELPQPAEGMVIRSFNDARGSGLRSRWRGAVLDVVNGEQVRAVHYGRVVYADWMQGYGFLVILDHGDGYLTLYSNLEEIRTVEDETVEAGARIGMAGEGSEAIAPGLYFEIRKNGDPLDPEDWWRAP